MEKEKTKKKSRKKEPTITAASMALQVKNMLRLCARTCKTYDDLQMLVNAIASELDAIVDEFEEQPEMERGKRNEIKNNQ